MTLINLPAICLLSGSAVRTLADYRRQRGAGKDPVFRAAEAGIREKTEFWT